MKITGMCVCVNYADLLARSIGLWHGGLDRMIVATTPDDSETINLCRKHNVETHLTNVFHENGAKFNKGAAMSELVFCKGLREHPQWILTFDADIVPRKNWRETIEDAKPVEGFLYGARRHRVAEKAPSITFSQSDLMPQKWIIGFFTMFHSLDPSLPPPSEPTFDIFWPHAGNYDTAFTNRWPNERRRLIRIELAHLGDERSNWLGRGKRKELFKEVFKHRPGIEEWKHERMTNPPTIRRSLLSTPAAK